MLCVLYFGCEDLFFLSMVALRGNSCTFVPRCSHKNDPGLTPLGWLVVGRFDMISGCASHAGVTLGSPRFSSALPPFLPLSGTPTNDTQQPTSPTVRAIANTGMPQYTINDSNNCLNTTNSFNNVWNNYTISDERPQLLTWLSPLDPGLRHWDIQDRRVDDVGEWLIQTEEYRRWCALDWEGEDDSAVLFCYGDPGVGKTFIR